jgi:calcineurin-like phosphoesterase family protein
MSGRIYVIADTHFGHKKICQFEPSFRPFSSVEEHDAALVRRWNSVVRSEDTVWHLGDVLFGKDSFEILSQLNGIKKLVMGNHDHYPTAEYLKHFNNVYGSVELKGCILTHIPVHPSQFYRYRANIHGHLHHNIIDDRRYICVSAEQSGLTPVLLDTVLETLSGRPA